MAPSAVVGGAPLKKAMTVSGEALARFSARSPAARRESPRGQLARSVWARARSV